MYNEEIQDELTSMFNNHGLEMGRMIYQPTHSNMLNTTVSTQEDGPFWFGDLDSNDLSIIQQISDKINKTFILSNEDNLSIAEITPKNIIVHHTV